MKAVGLWGPWGEGAGVQTLSLDPVSATPPGRGWWQGLGVEKEHEMIREV